MNAKPDAASHVKSDHSPDAGKMVDAPSSVASPSELVERLTGWREQLRAVGGYENRLQYVPAGGVREIIEDCEKAAALITAQADELARLGIAVDGLRYELAHQQDRWSPVETCPKDRQVLVSFLYYGKRDCAIATYWTKEGFIWPSKAHIVTHWMPLPAPPTGDAT